MHFSNSMLLVTALTAGSAVARLHGHGRRHAHPLEVNVEQPTVTDAPVVDADLDKRGACQMVTALIDGKLESWINKFGCDAEPTATEPQQPPPPPPTTTAEPAPAPAPSAVESQVPATPGGGDWTSTPANGQFSTAGFGQSNYKPGPLGVNWKGNTGNPYGSNIIEVPEASASQYRHVIRIEGSKTDPWTVVFFNKMGPDGLFTGFFSPHKALSFNLEPNEVKYVAVDTESTGGWAAAKGENVPISQWGSYAATWGEFTMRIAPDTTSWDVSAIQAQNAKNYIQGMKICQHDGTGCSSITNGMGAVNNAYTSALTNAQGIGGNVQTEAIRLLVNLDYAE